MKNNISTAAALMGSARTEAKAAAARENGAKGGRPAWQYKVFREIRDTDGSFFPLKGKGFRTLDEAKSYASTFAKEVGKLAPAGTTARSKIAISTRGGELIESIRLV